MIISTITRGESIHKAVLMAKSVKIHMPDTCVVVCVIEEKLYPGIETYFEYFDHVVFAKDIGFSNFHRFIFKYNSSQSTPAVKPQFLKYLLNTYANHNQIIYTDPDLIVFSPFKELIDLLDKSSIVLTPIYLEPSDIKDISREFECMTNGTFHSGLIGLTRTNEAMRFTNWWANVIELDYTDPINNSFLDKQWLDFIPSFFDGVTILKHPGYNVGFWNSHEAGRQMIREQEQYKGVHSPLRCFNFTGIDSYDSAWNSSIDSLKHDYLEWLANLGGLSQKVWSYDFFFNGEKILEEHRIYFKQNLAGRDQNMNPFMAYNSITFAQN